MNRPGESENEDSQHRKRFAAHIYADEGMDEGREEAEGGRLPSRYSIDYVAALPQSPTSLFVYWELSGERSMEFRDKFSRQPEWVLALINLDESGGVNWRSEVSVDPDVGSHYLRVQPGNRYRVELGVRADGVFHPICHSRERITPSDRPAPSRQPAVWRESGIPGRGGAPEPGKEPPQGLVWKEELLEGLSSSA